VKYTRFNFCLISYVTSDLQAINDRTLPDARFYPIEPLLPYPPDMSFGRPSSSFYPLLSIVQLLGWGFSGLDARRLLARDARPGIYDLLVRCSATSLLSSTVMLTFSTKADSSDIRTDLIQLCFSVDVVITLLEELNAYDNDRSGLSGRYADPFALL